ncbi:MAG TPA: PH domain-containing protein [Candidatus Binataceae bacterium]
MAGQAAFCSRCGARMFAPKPAAVREYSLALIRPSWIHSAQGFLVGALVIAFGAYVVWKNHDLWRAGFILMGAGVFILAIAVRVYRSVSWSLTSDRLVEKRGVLSSHRREMELSDIRSIEVDRRFMQRLMGLGNVIVSSAANRDAVIHLSDIAKPDAVAETVRLARLKRLA